MALPPSPNPMPPGNLPPVVPPPMGPVAGAPPLPGGALPLPGAPMPAAKAMPVAAPVGAPKPAGEGEEQPEDDGTIPLGFMQQPWVQNVLPFVSSLALHVGIVVLGLLTAKAVQVVSEMKPTEEQIIVPDSEIVEENAPGGVQNVGLGQDSTRAAAQDEFTENTSPQGWANKPGEDTVPSLEGGGSGEATTDPLIGLGPGGGFGKGGGMGSGAGRGSGSGTGSGAGALAPFGTPGGGGIGPKSRFMGVGGNARTVAFVCDASGSMIQTFSSLKAEITKAVQNLKAVQGFNIIFFQDEKASSLADGLLLGTPENKKKAFNYLDEVSTSGTTNPIPGIEIAFKSKPQLIYLLTDADFPDNKAVEAAISRLNATKQTKVNTIAFIPGDAGDDLSASFVDLMKKIAQDNGGVFKLVKESDLQ
jgi:hypothetical protein